MRIGLAQINPTLGDFKGNVEKIKKFQKEAEDAKCDVVAFPELSLCGYPPEDLLFEPDFIEACAQALKEVVSETGNTVVIIGFPERSADGKLYNAAAIARGGNIIAVYHKHELPNYGVFDEKRYFTPGKEALIFRLGRAVFGVNICEDIWVEDGVALEQARKGAKLLINISGSPYHLGKLNVRLEVLKKKVRDTGAWLCYVNLVGGQDELVFDGTSVVINPEGEIVVRGERFAEELVIVDIPEEKISSQSIEAIYLGELSKEKKPSVEVRAPRALNEAEEVFNALVLGTRDYLRKNGFSKAVVGLSGGIDSSVTVCVAVEAIGRENVLGVSMPSRYTSSETKNDARKLAENLGIQFHEISIEPIFSAFLKSLESLFKDLPPDVTEENLQARIRGSLLMAISNKFGHLVLATGNKSEMAVGYCTLYGDMVGGYAPLKDVPKTLVYEIANLINRKAGREVIPSSIIERPPTAELRPGQKDEDDLPPYRILDPIIRLYVEEDKKADEISRELNIEREVVRRVIRMIMSNEYKRRQAPPGVKITPRAFGKDWRFPIAKRFSI